MTRQKNNRYLGILWALSFGVIVLVLVELSASISATVNGRSALPVVSIVFGLVFALGLRAYAKRRVERAFLQRGPESLLRVLRPGGGSLIPSGAAWGAYLEAWAFTLYGRFDSAREALARVEWKHEPPVVGAAATSVEALLCFFDTRDFVRGFNLARTARAAADSSGHFPGVKTAMQSYDSLVEIGRVLTDNLKADTIANLRSQAQTLPIGARLIATWGLATAYARTGDAAQANETLARCTTLAPYCEPLCFLPEPIRTASTPLTPNDPEPGVSEP